jgi:hypothetical protein
MLDYAPAMGAVDDPTSATRSTSMWYTVGPDERRDDGARAGRQHRVLTLALRN